MSELKIVPLQSYSSYKRIINCLVYFPVIIPFPLVVFNTWPKPLNIPNRRVCDICFGILITVHNKYTLILGLWKCGTITQLYYYIVDIYARAGY